MFLTVSTPSKRTRDPQRDARPVRLDDARRDDGVLLGEAVQDGLRADAEIGELHVIDVDKDPLLLRAVDRDFGHVGHFQEPLARRLGHELHLRIVGALGPDGVEQRIDVPVLVVDARSEDAVRKVGLDVRHLPPDEVEQPGHLAGWRAVAEFHLRQDQSRLREGLDRVEPGQLLQLLLDPVGNLELHLLCGGARPRGSDDRGLDRERGILVATEIDVSHRTGAAQHQDQEQDQRLMGDGPGGKIETAHGALPFQNDSDWVGRTTRPSSSFSTPSVTTLSPSLTPFAISTFCPS